jgi:hypothetical protein
VAYATFLFDFFFFLQHIHSSRHSYCKMYNVYKRVFLGCWAEIRTRAYRTWNKKVIRWCRRKFLKTKYNKNFKNPSGSCSQRKIVYYTPNFLYQVVASWYFLSLLTSGVVDTGAKFAVFPTGRFFGRISQKGPNKNVGAAGKICCRILTGFSQKGPKRGRIHIMFCFLNF